MGRYLFRRLAHTALVAVTAVTVVFFLARLVPGDPARVALGPDATEEMVAHYRHEMGLDRPLAVQYWLYLTRVARGDLGSSVLTGNPVAREMLSYLPATVELMLASLVISLAVAIPAGVMSATGRNRWYDHAVRVISVGGLSLPVFWFGIVLQIVFYARLGWLPVGGRIGVDTPAPRPITGLYVLDAALAGDWPAMWSALRHLVLPAAALSLINVAAIARMVRSAMLDALHEDYVASARAKGLPERVVVYRHALRNALVPVITVVGLRVGTMFGGAVLTETVFAWPGLGRYVYYALRNVDYPVVTGFTLWMSLAYAAVNLAVDLAYAVADPRVRLSGMGP